MNIEARVDKRLWAAIQNAYEARNFTTAILDAIYFLSNLIREKTGLQSDGVALAGQALGGVNPPLKVNKLQTESEQNVQKGLEQLLRGIYQSIRNPRSHDKLNDSSEDADAIILFINYLLRIIDQSKSVFTKADALKRIFDPYFFPNTRYAQLLAADIPSRHRLEVYVDAYRAKQTGEGNKLSFSFHALFSDLSDHEKRQVYELVSEDMMNAETEETIRFIIQTQPITNWTNYTETSRLRIESKLIASIREGRYSAADDKCSSGSIGTWASRIAPHFTLRKEYINAIATLLSSEVTEHEDYAFKYLFPTLYLADVPPSTFLATVVKTGLINGDLRYKRALDWMLAFHQEASPQHKWASQFNKEYHAFKEGKKQTQPASFDDMDDDIPF